MARFSMNTGLFPLHHFQLTNEDDPDYIQDDDDAGVDWTRYVE